MNSIERSAGSFGNKLLRFSLRSALLATLTTQIEACGEPPEPSTGAEARFRLVRENFHGATFTLMASPTGVNVSATAQRFTCSSPDECTVEKDGADAELSVDTICQQPTVRCSTPYTNPLTEICFDLTGSYNRAVVTVDTPSGQRRESNAMVYCNDRAFGIIVKRCTYSNSSIQPTGVCFGNAR